MNPQPVQATKGQLRGIAVFCVAVAIYLIAVAQDLVTVNAGLPAERRPILFALAVFFLLCGLLAGRWWSDESPWTAALGALAMTLLAGIAAWVALMGNTLRFHGGIAANGIAVQLQSTGFIRLGFSIATLLTLGCAAYGWRCVFTQNTRTRP